MDYSIPGEILAAARKPVFPYQIHGRRVFVKKRRPNKNPLGRLAQDIIYRLTDNLLVIPPAPPVGNNVSFEVGVLRRLGELGVRVPRVLHATDDYFVMSNVGETVEGYLRRHPDRTHRFVEKAILELRRFHDLGLAHGGALVRNLTLLSGKVYFIDFEENIPARHLEKFQVRDVFLFLMSLERNNHNPDLPGLCRLYDGGTDRGTFEQIRKPLLKLRLTKLLDSRLFSLINMRDIRSLNRLIRKAEKPDS